MDKISIIIPVYNAEKYLSICLNSVINQTYKSIEIICINDGSNDKSINILKEYKIKDDRIVIIDKSNNGISNTRNIGIKESTGKYITFLDSDDWLELDAIENMYKIIIETGCDFIRTNYSLYNEKNGRNELGIINKKLEKKYLKSNFYDIKKYILNSKIPAYVWLLLIKRDILIKNKIRFDENLIMMEDTYFFIELLNNCNSFYLKNIKTCNYRYNLSSTSNSSKRYEKNIKGILELNSKIKKILNNDYNLIELCDRTQFRIINDFLEKIIFNHDDSKRILAIFNYLRNNKIFIGMNNNILYKKLDKREKAFFKSFKYNQYDYIDKYYVYLSKRKKYDNFCDVIEYKCNRIYRKYILRKKVD